MSIDRFFLGEPFNINDEKILKEGEYKHLKVMRIQPKSSFYLVNGKGSLAKAILLKQAKDHALCKIETVKTINSPEKKSILALSYLKASKLEWIVEKTTELGIDEFYFFPAEKSEKTSCKKGRLLKISISALKQCGRLFLPQIHFLESLKSLPQQTNIYFGDMDTENIFPLNNLSEINTITFIIGPEKGFSTNEIFFLKSTLKAKGIKINNHTLRAETAAIAASSIIQYFLNLET